MHSSLFRAFSAARQGAVWHSHRLPAVPHSHDCASYPLPASDGERILTPWHRSRFRRSAVKSRNAPCRTRSILTSPSRWPEPAPPFSHFLCPRARRIRSHKPTQSVADAARAARAAKKAKTAKVISDEDIDPSSNQAGRSRFERGFGTDFGFSAPNAARSENRSESRRGAACSRNDRDREAGRRSERSRARKKNSPRPRRNSIC